MKLVFIKKNVYCLFCSDGIVLRYLVNNESGFNIGKVIDYRREYIRMILVKL